MNVESLKSELQQVLDNDVVLRKEFNALKRSLSDYRNQLIMRDEDCKRLQVTIDVLNTKLVVVERDCNTYKAELMQFKELRGTIQEQLQSKQEEIDGRLSEIQGLRDDLNTMATGYEEQIESLKMQAGSELAKVKEDYIAQIEELRSNIHYKETGIKEEYENRVSELSMSWADREQNLMMVHQEAVTRLKEEHALEVRTMSEHFVSQLSAASSAGHEENALLKLNHQTATMQMEEAHAEKIESLETGYKTEISRLKQALEEQRNTLTTNFNSRIETLSAEYVAREANLVAGYQEQIEGLKNSAGSQSEELSATFQAQVNELKASHESLIHETVTANESRIAALIAEYEEKLSNTLIHSNQQNSKLNEELTRAQASNENSGTVINSLTEEVEARRTDVDTLKVKVEELEMQLRNEAERYLALSGEYAAFKESALPINDEKINELNAQIATLNLTHSDYAAELTSQIDHLNEEIKNMSVVFESTTNSLSETELALELKIQELGNASLQIDSLLAEKEEREAELENSAAEIEEKYASLLNEKETEFQKLLAENATIIDEIDIAQDKVEAQEAEIQILKAELDEMTSQNSGKSELFKETLSAKNFEITNLEANNAAYCEEISQLKKEVTKLEEELNTVNAGLENMTALQNNFEKVNGEKNELLAQIGALSVTIQTLNENTALLTGKLSAYEEEIEALAGKARTEEQDAFIDKLFKQIDALNDEKLALLDEKEQMAAQLLKMNEVLTSFSQQVDTEQIDVSGLNNHRKNIILATNSEGSQDSLTKKQINDLVREIDKCIALLSA
jgi:chromosome segregation ATPase